MSAKLVLKNDSIFFWTHSGSGWPLPLGLRAKFAGRGKASPTWGCTAPAAALLGRIGSGACGRAPAQAGRACDCKAFVGRIGRGGWPGRGRLEGSFAGRACKGAEQAGAPAESVRAMPG